MPIPVEKIKKLEIYECYVNRMRGLGEKVTLFLKEHSNMSYTGAELTEEFNKNLMGPDQRRYKNNQVYSVLSAIVKEKRGHYKTLIVKKGNYYWFEPQLQRNSGNLL